MAIIVNPSNVQIGLYVLCETSTGICFTGSARALKFNDSSPLWGANFGYASGGRCDGPVSTCMFTQIDKFPFATDTNAVEAGNLASFGRHGTAGVSSQVNGYVIAGYGGNPVPTSTHRSCIERFPFTAPFATTSNVGNLTDAGRYGVAGASSPVSGYAMGGLRQGTRYSCIEKFLFTAESSVSNIGSLTNALSYTAGISSLEHGYAAGASTPTTYLGCIDKFPFSTNSGKVMMGVLTNTLAVGAGASSSISGYHVGGSTPTTKCSTIQKFPFATDSSATNIGNLLAALDNSTGISSNQSGYTAGGSTTVLINNIGKFPFASEICSTNIGTLSTTCRYQPSGTQD